MKTAKCTWNDVANVDGYNVYFRPVGGTFTKHNEELIPDTEYHIEGLDDGEYEAYATSVRDDLESDPSNIATFYIGEYQVFTESGTWNWEAAGSPEFVEVLVVAGGGGGGYGPSGNTIPHGGGGAGGYIFEGSFPVSGNVPVIVGQGGMGGDGDEAVFAANGEDSQFGSLLAIGGGGGGAGSAVGDGGSGGGTSNTENPGSGTPGQGNDGGIRSTSGFNSGGGGGATQVGESPTTDKSGDGGDGVDLSATYGFNFGDLGWFAGGGAGGVYNSGESGVGGKGGGGDATGPASAGEPGMPQTGGGGAAGGTNNFSTGQSDGGDGGSGIVIVRAL